MKTRNLLVASVLSACLTPGIAQSAQTVVTFEDVQTFPSSSPVYETGQVADGYGGISGWSLFGEAWKILDPAYGDGQIDTNFFYGSSGELIFDNAPVVLEGMYYKSYSADPVNPITSIELYYQGQLVHGILDPRAPLGMVWVASGYAGLVDKINIYGGGEGFSIDNLTYSTSPVPESKTYAMFLAGLGLIGLPRNRQRVASERDGAITQRNLS